MATLYAAKGNAVSDLFTLDPVTGAATSLGSIGRAITGLAFDPTVPTDLYAATSKNDPAWPPNFLLKLDPADGSVLSTLPNSIATLPDVCFDLAGQFYGWENATSKLAIIDKATGLYTAVPGGGNAITSFGCANAIRSDGTMFVFPRGGPSSIASNTYNGRATYYTVDKTTGVATLVGILTGGPVNDNPPVAAATFDGADLCWAILNESGGTCYLVTINVATGAVATIATLTGVGWDALAWDTTGGGPTLTAAFTAAPRHGTAPLAVAFTDQSTGGVTGWLWSFGDGDTSTVQNPVHTYEAGGSYDVELTVT